MHHIEPVAMWFLFVITGVMLTMLLTQLVSAPSRRARTRHEWTTQPGPEAAADQTGALVRIGKGPDVYVVSTSGAWGIPRVASDQEVTNPPQAA